MAEPKTRVNNASVAGYLSAISNTQVREDCRTIATIMQTATKAKPKMWGPSIVGFGEHRVVYAGGREADWMLIGFSPRKQDIALYGVHHDAKLLAKLGTHSCGKGCLYIKRLSDVHVPTLKTLVRASVQRKKKTGE